MGDTTHNLALPFVMPQQAQKHVPVNEALQILDTVTQLVVLSRGLSAPPGSAADGDRYIVGESASGEWTGYENDVAVFHDAAWHFVAPQTGWRAWAEDEGSVLVFTASGWQAAIKDPVSLPSLGINAMPDPENRFIAHTSNILLSHDGDDIQIKINKATTADTGSLHFQNNFTSHAEVGLVGDNDLQIKVSDDGTNFMEAMSISADTGNVGIGGHSAPSQALTVKGWIRLDDEQGSSFDFRSDGSIDLRRSVGVAHYIRTRTNGNLLYFGGADSTGTLIYPLVVHGEANSVRPSVDNSTTLGTETRKWSEVHADKIISSSFVKLGAFAIATLPSAAAAGPGALVFVSDAPGGAVPAYSDGSNWRHIADQTIIL